MLQPVQLLILSEAATAAAAADSVATSANSGVLLVLSGTICFLIALLGASLVAGSSGSAMELHGLYPRASEAFEMGSLTLPVKAT